jgi:hypothetical protein
MLTPALAEYLKPYQYAIGRKGGAEEIHKLIQTHLQLHPNMVLVSLDVRAAFSEIETTLKHFTLSLTRGWSLGFSLNQHTRVL